MLREIEGVIVVILEGSVENKRMRKERESERKIKKGRNEKVLR